MCDFTEQHGQNSKLTEAVRLIAEAACDLISVSGETELSRKLVNFIRENGNVSAESKSRRNNSCRWRGDSRCARKGRASEDRDSGGEGSKDS